MRVAKAAGTEHGMGAVEPELCFTNRIPHWARRTRKHVSAMLLSSPSSRVQLAVGPGQKDHIGYRPTSTGSRAGLAGAHHEYRKEALPTCALLTEG